MNNGIVVVLDTDDLISPFGVYSKKAYLNRNSWLDLTDITHLVREEHKGLFMMLYPQVSPELFSLLVKEFNSDVCKKALENIPPDGYVWPEYHPRSPEDGIVSAIKRRYGKL